MPCDNIKKNLEICTCGSADCERKGKCCECLAFHLSIGSLPSCAAQMMANKDR